MIPWYYVALGIAAVLVAAVSYKTPRAVMWIACLAASFAISVGYLRGYEAIEAANELGVFTADTSHYVALGRDWLPPSLVAAACDAVVCLLIFVYGRERWETFWLYSIALGMMAVNMIYSSGVLLGFPPIPDRDTLGIILEAMNYAALLLIGGTGILDRVRDGNDRIRGALDRFLVAGRSYLHTPARKSLWLKR